MTRLSSTTDRITLLIERVLGTLLSEIPEALRVDLLARISALVERLLAIGSEPPLGKQPIEKDATGK
jgi:hypothetical protein